MGLGPHWGVKIGGWVGCPQLAAASKMGWVASPGTSGMVLCVWGLLHLLPVHCVL